MPEKKAKAAAKRATKTKAKKKTTKTKATKAKATKKKATKTKATKRATAPTSTGTGRVRVKQVRSGIGHADTYRRTLRALGLKHHQDEVVVTDNPSVRGMLFKVRHLVAVTPEEA